VPSAVRLDAIPGPPAAAGRWSRAKSRIEAVANRLIVSRLWPWPSRAVMIGFLLVLTYFSLFGPRDPRLNVATVFSWIVWWPLLAISYLLFGRIWCAVCPMGALADLTQRFSLNLKAPTFFKRRGFVAGILLVAILYQAWIEEVTRASVSPLVTGFILWGFTVGALVGALLFERWTWCRHLCPLGAWTGVFAMGSMMEIRANQPNCVDNKCHSIYCYFGREELKGCPFHHTPKTMDTNRYCSMCGNCLKACPNGSLRFSLRSPIKEFVTQKKEMPENALIAVAAIGVVAFQAFVMTEPWAALRELVAQSAILSNDAVFYGGLLIGFVALAVGLFLAASKAFSLMAGTSCSAEVCRFGFAFLPLALFAHVGHNLGHLLGGYRLVPVAVAASLGAPAQIPEGDAMLGLAVWRGLQFVLLAIGVALSVWALRRLCAASAGRCPSGRRLLPYAILTAVFALTFAVILSLPMASRL
jgi:polyferredoxin